MCFYYLLLAYFHALYKVQLSSFALCSGFVFCNRCCLVPNLSTKLRYLFQTCKHFNI